MTQDIITLISIGITYAIVNNVVLSQFLGICPFLGVSKKTETAAGMGGAVIFVIGIASLCTSLINEFILSNEMLLKAGIDLSYLKTIVFILVIASLVQFVEMFLKKSMPALYQALGVYLPLITTNCAVLGVSLNAVSNEYNILESVVYGLSIAIGFFIAIVIMAGIREKIEYNDIPKPFQGTAIVLITAALMSIAFMGFSGINVENIINEKTDYEKKVEEYKQLITKADDFATIKLDEAAIEKFLTDGAYTATVDEVIKGTDKSGATAGYLVQVTSKGFSEGLSLMVAVEADGTLQGYTVVSHAETEGFGTKAFEEDFMKQFAGIKRDQLADVDTIAGATITSEAVIEVSKIAIGCVDVLEGREPVFDEKKEPEKPEEPKDPNEVLFSNGADFKALTIDQAAADKFISDGGYAGVINAAEEVYDANGTLLGHTVQITVAGYKEGLVLKVGVDTEGKITGYVAVSHGETAGLGTKAFADDYMQQFIGKTAEEAGDVDTIAYATITSSAVVKAVKAATAYAGTLTK